MEQERVLRDVAHGPPQREAVVIRKTFSIYKNFSLFRPDEPDQNIDQGALAGAMICRRWPSRC